MDRRNTVTHGIEADRAAASERTRTSGPSPMRRPRFFPYLCSSVFICGSLLLGGCPRLGGPAEGLTLFVSGDSRGYLEPCGCRRDQAGGLPGRASVIRGSKAKEKLVLDVGN